MDGGTPGHDPYTWSTQDVHDFVVSTWTGFAFDSTALGQAIIEMDLNGATLLRFEHFMSKQELFTDLNIKTLSQKVAFAELVENLQSTSRQFRKWDRLRTKKKQAELDEAASSRSSSPAPQLPEPVFTDHQPDAEAHLTPTSPTNAVANGFDPTGRPGQNVSLERLERDASPIEENRPVKRKRLAPTNLTTGSLGSTVRTLPTEADMLDLGSAFTSRPAQSGQDDLVVWEQADGGAYLGAGSLSLADIKSSEGSLSTNLVTRSDGDFATIIPNKLPVGRRMAVAKGMKHMLVKNSRREAAEKFEGVRAHSESPSDSEDEVYDLVDLPDYFDEETQREIDAEKLETERHLAMQADRYLDSERVAGLLDDCITEMARHWTEKKLYKHQRRAHGIWTQARRRGTRTHQVLRARKQAEFYSDRIGKLREGIMDEKWIRDSEVRQQARCLEQNVEDRMYQLWLVRMLESRTEPPKAAAIQRPRPTIRPVVEDDAVEGEVLTSSDDDLDDFIVPDDIEMDGQAVADAPSPMRDDYSPTLETPMKQESSVFMDLTRFDTPQSTEQTPIIRRRSNFIDLTTPTKATPVLDSSPVNGHPWTKPDEGTPSNVRTLEEVQEIGSMGNAHWSKQNDRFRLAICMLFQLRHLRREAVLRLLRQPSLEDSWEYVERHLADPLTNLQAPDADEDRVAAFDLTRVYYSFYKCRAYKESRICELTERDKKKIGRSKDESFPIFQRLICDTAPFFPKASQIYQTDLGDLYEDDEFGGVEAAEDEAKSTGSRKLPSKEIVQNRDAVELRERERQRVNEQEVRRRNLRKALANSGEMSRDKSRLIINETKQEDQPFIYVNDEIGKRIKDHQIDGVRFLWNLITLDADIRQGCLLAHTMGLGKTMQVITLLVAILESAASEDPGIKSQIPVDLRNSQTLVLCPSGLVDNWMDELLLWAPDGLLGQLRKVDAQLSLAERLQAVQDWSAEGGVLIIGYRMFTQVLKDDETNSSLIEKPNIVIADEAHHFKNRKAVIHDVCSQLRTKTRIAMTGSPLANHVQEYHAMIDWVAPNFLGPPDEFRDIYAIPIQQGLWSDSLGYEKRRALKMLRVLKDTCAPKMDRKTINSCSGLDLPVKHEFVIAVSPTSMQETLYGLYINQVLNETGGSTKLRQADLFNIVNNLGLICNHPLCFRNKALEILEDAKNNSQPPSFPVNIIPSVLKETRVLDVFNAALSHKVECLNTILEEARLAGDKVLVFSQSIATLDYLQQLLQSQRRRAARLDGSTTISKRQSMVKQFNLGDQEVYLVSTTAGGVGLNIQGANRVVIFDSKWNPVNDQQAVGRAYRIGQRKPVYVYRFLVAGTFEEDMHNKAVFKTQLASRVVDKKNPISWSNRLGKVVHAIKPVPRATDLDTFRGKDPACLDKLLADDGERQVIRYIVSTDTFEEEDPNIDLTVEEQKEAENLVTMNRLRVTDPQEYERVKGAEKELAERLRSAPSRPMQNHGLAHGQAPPPSTAPASHSHTGQPPLPSEQSQVTGAQDQQQAAQSHPSATQSYPVASQSHPSVAPSHPRVSQSTNGASDSVAAAPYHSSTGGFPYDSLTQGAQVPTQHSIPSRAYRWLEPIRGANTYFGRVPDPTHTASHASSPSIPTPTMQTPPLGTPPVHTPGQTTPTQQSNLFRPPANDERRRAFQTKLAAQLQRLQKQRISGISGPPPTIAQNICIQIEHYRKEKGAGFLPDQQHWRLLEDMLDHENFVIAAVSGRLTASYLALADRSEMEVRVQALVGLSDAESRNGLGFHADPENLKNIRRVGTSVQARQGSKANEDLKIMREAADNRKQREFRLPPWASKALSESSGAVFSRNDLPNRMRER